MHLSRRFTFICLLLAIFVSYQARGEDQASNEAENPVHLLESFLAEKSADMGKIAEQDFAHIALTKEQAERAKSILWQHHVKTNRATRSKEIEQRKITYDQWELKFEYTIFGEMPKGGRSLYISMHGGGGTVKRVNDQQWKNQQRLYEPAEGIYLCPRAPSDKWNLWHQAHIDPLFDRLIEDLIVLEQVNPNRVYLMGYSAGGDGVYQLAPRLADRLAAAAMMGGHPNETKPLGLRNLPFTLHVGEKDAAYKRNQVAAKWGVELADLRAKDPGGYCHWVEIHKGKGHWMQRQDAFAVPWMARYTRDPLPDKIVWKQDDVTRSRFYWLAVHPDFQQARTLIQASRDGQRIDISSDSITEVVVRLNDDFVNLDQPVEITFNGTSVHEGRLKRSIDVLAKTLMERGDPAAVFSIEVTARSVDADHKAPGA